MQMFALCLLLFKNREMAENNRTGENKQEGNQDLSKQRIIVIGASAGGFEAIKKIIHNLPPEVDASIFIVWHMSAEVKGVLPQVLNRENKIFAAHAYNE